MIHKREGGTRPCAYGSLVALVRALAGRLCPEKNVFVDVRGPGGLLRAPGAGGRHQRRARLGAARDVLRPLLDFFHSAALNIDTLTRLWAALVVERHPGLLRVNGRLVLVGDGFKVAKAGKKMPAVKRLHQLSESNTKPSSILGHSCQAVALLAQGLAGIVAIPLAARIHEGLVFSNRDRRTVLDKMLALLGVLGLDAPYNFVADAYYASRKIASPLLRAGHHLITRVRHNTVGYRPAPKPCLPKRDGPKCTGTKSPSSPCSTKPRASRPSKVPSTASPA